MRKIAFVLAALLAAPFAAHAETAEGGWEVDFEGIVGYGTAAPFANTEFTLKYDDFAGATIAPAYWDKELSLEQVFLFVQSEEGRLEIGWTYNMARKLGVIPPDVGPLNLNDEYLFLNSKFLHSAKINTDGNSIKLNFMSDIAEGLVLAASYDPDRTDISKRNESENYRNFERLYAAAAKYDIGDVAFSGGIVRFDKWGGGSDRYEYQLGAKYYEKGFQVAAAWRYVPMAGDAAFSVGGAYEFGPIEASLTQFSSRMTKDWASVSMLSGKYKISKTFAISASVGREAYIYEEGLGRTGIVAGGGLSINL